jgi:Lon protease-like protein
MPAAVQSEPLNRTITQIINHFFADQVAARREADAEDESGGDHEKDLPLFVCTLSFPTMPTFLHIFEPRYRLMIRRVVESGNGKFGMVMYNRRGREQGDGLGSTTFMQYGTLLMVERYELLPDGRSLVIATGVARFKVLEAGELDGYHVAKTERVDDISLAEEERLEAMETAASAIPDPTDPITTEPPLDSLSTQELLDLSRDFIRNQRQSGAPWLHPRVMLAYGPVPTDAARFPWWFASILPIAEEEKYPILSAVSVRERLKISARWARELESRDW